MDSPVTAGRSLNSCASLQDSPIRDASLLPPTPVPGEEELASVRVARLPHSNRDLRWLRAAFWRYSPGGVPLLPEEGGGRDFNTLMGLRLRRDRVDTLVIASSENPFGRSGGLYAVTNMLPGQVQRFLKENPDFDEGIHPGEIIVVSPFHRKLATAVGQQLREEAYERAKRAESEWPDPWRLNRIPFAKPPIELTVRVTDTCRIFWNGECSVPFGRSVVKTPIYRIFREGDGAAWFLFGSDGFFEADGGIDHNDPYVYSHESPADRDGADSLVLRDALFQSAALPYVLKAIGRSDNLLVHLQDWQFLPAVLTVSDAQLEGVLGRVSKTATLHNPFDHWLPEHKLELITRRCKPYHYPAIDHENRSTVIGRMAPLLDTALSTVSEGMALEFRGRIRSAGHEYTAGAPLPYANPLIDGHFAGHYRRALDTIGIAGIRNGIFEPLKDCGPGFDGFVQSCKNGRWKPLWEWKLERRREMLCSLERYLSAEGAHAFGTLRGSGGKALSTLDGMVPIFMMVGRLDPGQKGFDVLTRAVEALPEGLGRFIISPLTPLPQDHAISHYFRDLKSLAERRAGEVVVLPFRIDSGMYQLLRGGVTFSVWPSLYEPFGGVTEWYIHGTPVIARAVGGLSQQVRDFNRDPLSATGYLYFEPGFERSGDVELPAYLTWQSEWRSIQAEREPRDRMRYGRYSAQVGSLTVMLLQAATDYRNHPELYTRMLANLPEMAASLSWNDPVADYLRWYGRACD